MDIEELDQQIKQALAVLNSRQRKFVEVFASGDNQMSAALKAGYSANTAHVQASQLLNKPKFAKVQHAVALMRDKYALDHGVPAAWKREMLKKIANTASEPGDNYQPGSAVSAVKVLSEIDGDIGSGRSSAGGPTVTINIGIPTRVETVIEHEDTNAE